MHFSDAFFFCADKGLESRVPQIGFRRNPY